MRRNDYFFQNKKKKRSYMETFVIYFRYHFGVNTDMYDSDQVIDDTLSIMIDNTTKKSNKSTILNSIKTPIYNEMAVTECSVCARHYVNTGKLTARPQ